MSVSLLRKLCCCGPVCGFCPLDRTPAEYTATVSGIGVSTACVPGRTFPAVESAKRLSGDPNGTYTLRNSEALPCIWYSDPIPFAAQLYAGDDCVTTKSGSITHVRIEMSRQGNDKWTIAMRAVTGFVSDPPGSSLNVNVFTLAATTSGDTLCDAPETFTNALTGYSYSTLGVYRMGAGGTITVTPV